MHSREFTSFQRYYHTLGRKDTSPNLYTFTLIEQAFDNRDLADYPVIPIQLIIGFD
jgi:hypothetical protein